MAKPALKLLKDHSNQERYQAVIENAYDAFISIDGNGNILDWNHQAELTFGWKKSEVHGKGMAEIVIPARLRETHKQGFKTFLKGGASNILNRRIEVTALHRNGDEIPVEMTISKITVGKEVIFCAFLHNITNRKRIEKLIRVRSFVSEVLGNAQEIDEGMQHLLQAFCVTLGWELGVFWRYNQEEDVLTLKQTWHALKDKKMAEFKKEMAKSQIERGHGTAGRVWINQESEWTECFDTTALENIKAVESGLLSSLTFPVGSGEAFRGVLVFYSTNVKKQDLQLVDLVKDIGNHASQFIKQKESVSKLQNFYLELERRVEERTRDIRIIMNNAPIVLWSIDRAGVFTVSKGRGLEVLGYQNEQLVGKSAWEFYANSPDVILQIRRALEGEDFHAEFKLKDRWFETHYNPIFDSRGLVTGVVGISTDVTDRKIIEIETKKAREAADIARVAAEQSALAKSNFLANMSHEIRTPLGAILGFVDLILNSEHTETERLDWLKKIAYNGDHVLHLIDEILDLSKIEAGHMALESAPVDVKTLVEEAVSLFSERAKEKAIDLSISAEGPMPEAVLADPMRLRQILINLLGNAVKFTDSGKVTVTVQSTTDKRNKSRISFRVSDTGAGIAPDHIPRLFQPFTQADSSHSRIFGGTGLGLALSKRLAKSMNGDLILVDSKPGKGSTFHFFFEAPVIEQPRALKRNSNTKGPLPDLSECMILLVEDSPDNQLLISRFLKQAHGQVEVASDGKEGFTKAMSKNYDVILMDIQMPRQDGYVTTAKLREQGYKGPIIALTAHALAEEKKKSLSVGCNDHLTKPVDRFALIEAVIRHIN